MSTENSTDEKDRAPSSEFWVTELQKLHSSVDRFERRQEGNLRTNNWKIVLDVLTLVVVAGYAFVAFQQWGEMRRANNIAKEAVVASTRPWVGVVPVLPFKEPEVGKAPTIRLEAKNYGKSPAFNLRAKWGLVLDTATLTEGKIIEKYKNSKWGVHNLGTLWPEQTPALSSGDALSYPLTEELFNDINTGKLRIMAIGQIEYRDADDREHHTWVQIVYHPHEKNLELNTQKVPHVMINNSLTPAHRA